MKISARIAFATALLLAAAPVSIAVAADAALASVAGNWQTEPDDGAVIGCVYRYPPEREGDVTVQSWVRADRSDLDGELADAVAAWLAAEWPWQQPDRCGR